MIKIYRLFMVLLLGLLMSCEQVSVERDEFLSMGTLVNLSVAGIDAEKMQRVSTAIQDDFKYMHNAWHPWKAGPLGRVNSLLSSKARFSLPPSLKPVILQAQQLSKQSDGLFNPAIGQLITLWGFEKEDMPTAPPSQADIDAWLAKAPSMQDVEVDGFTIQAKNDAVLLDFGAFAKGYAVDRSIEHLRKMGVENAIVNAGGDLRAIGSKGGKPWVIGIRHPRQSGVLASLELVKDESVFTSGDYERFFDAGGKRYHHILDPRTGYPARGLTSVTVLHSSAAVADAAATALFVAGPSGWLKMAKKMGLTEVMVISEAGDIQMTPAMQKRLRFTVSPMPDVTILTP